MTGFRIGEKFYSGSFLILLCEIKNYSYYKFAKQNLMFITYLIGRKTDKERVHYVKLNNNDPQLEFYFARSNETNRGKMHRNGYLRNNPPNS